MPANLDHALFSDFLREHSRDGRDVQLYDVHGQTVFPMWAEDGALRTSVAVYPIIRGKGECPPSFTGVLPQQDSEYRDLGDGWFVMCVHFSYYSTLQEKIGKLEKAEAFLRITAKQQSGG